MIERGNQQSRPGHEQECQRPENEKSEFVHGVIRKFEHALFDKRLAPVFIWLEVILAISAVYSEIMKD